MIDQNLLICKSLGTFDAGFFVLQYIEELQGLTCTTCHTIPTCTILTDESSFWLRRTESTLSKKEHSARRPIQNRFKPLKCDSFSCLNLTHFIAGGMVNFSLVQPSSNSKVVPQENGNLSAISYYCPPGNRDNLILLNARGETNAASQFCEILSLQNIVID